MSILNYADMARDAWDNLPAPKRNRLKTFFHLRPTNSGITIVTTLPYAPMRGITKLTSQTDLATTLSRLYDKFPKLVQDNVEEAKAILTSMGFASRPGREGILEEAYQAIMINGLNNGDGNVARALNVRQIQFIASELIFERGHHRVDIVGFDQSAHTLYFFELKKDRTTRVNQAREYVDYYSQPRQSEILQQLLSRYPIFQIPQGGYTSIRGIMVMRHAENSTTNWQRLAEAHNVGILFFRPTLSFVGIR